MADRSTYFEQESLWGKPPAPYQERVREDILALLGSGVGSILDVGCGDGVITNALPGNLRVTGADISEEALKHISREKVRADASDLPFEDKSFDLVMANDVLEHLPSATLEAVLAEMTRVARRWILITVPFMESLASGMTRCGACGAIYHVNHHERSFGVKELRSLMAGREPALLMFSGAAMDPLEALQRRLRGCFGVLNSWDSALCPQCGTRASVGDTTKMGALLNRAAEELAPLLGDAWPNRSECIALYALDATLPIPLPEVRDQPGPFLLRAEGGALRQIPAELQLEASRRTLRPRGSRKADKSLLYLWERADGIHFLYGKPHIFDGGCVIPPWFNREELPRMTVASSKQLGWLETLAGYLIAQQLVGEAKAGDVADRIAWESEKASLLTRVGQVNQLSVDLQNVRAENDSLKIKLGRGQQLEIDIQNTRAENDALKQRIGRQEQLAVDHQNLMEEARALKATVGRLEQVEVQLQNVRAENDALKRRVAQADQLAVEIQNLRAENDALTLRSGQADQLAVEVQNLRAENDAFKVNAGRAEQIAIDLQNVRAENDALKLRAGRLEQMELDLQNLRNENTELRLQMARRDAADRSDESSVEVAKDGAT